MKRILFTLLTVMAITGCGGPKANETNGGKEIFAGLSVLNQPMPEMHIDMWLGDKPDTKGKFVLYEFWATYCAPCLQAVPHLNEMADKFADKLVVIGIAPQSAETVRNMKEPVMNYFVAVDEQGTNIESLRLEGIPHSKLVTPKGIVVWEGCPVLEGYELTDEVVEALITKYGK